MSTQVEFPIDPRQIEKGALITTEQIERHSGRLRDDNRFAFSMMTTKQWLEREMFLLGNTVTIKSEGQQLRVLTDAEAAEYNPRLFENGQRSMVKAHTRLMAVNEKMLDSDAQRRLEHRLQTQGMVLAAMRSVKPGAVTADEVKKIE